MNRLFITHPITLYVSMIFTIILSVIGLIYGYIFIYNAIQKKKRKNNRICVDSDDLFFIVFILSISLVVIFSFIFYGKYEKTHDLYEDSIYYNYLKEENPQIADYLLDMKKLDKKGLFRSFDYDITSKEDQSEVTFNNTLFFYPNLSNSIDFVSNLNYTVEFNMKDKPKLKMENVESTINYRDYLLLVDVTEKFKLNIKEAIFDSKKDELEIKYLLNSDDGNIYNLIINLKNKENPEVTLKEEGKEVYSKDYKKLEGELNKEK